MPKEMLPVVDKPLIQYAVEECIASGIENVIFVTGRRKSAIEDHFDFAPELEHFLEERGKSEQAQMVRAISGGNILDARRNPPEIPARVLHRAAAITIELVRRRLL